METILQSSGVLMAAARAALGRGGPWWQPVLFLRGDGRLWQEPAAPQRGGGLHIAGDVGNVQQINISSGSVGSIIGQQVNARDAKAASSAAVQPLLDRIDTHRATIAHYVGQIAMVGEANARPEATHGIRQARSEIKRIKAYLAKIGVQVDDHPDDE
jgi:enamine deaminase RidA (YjgF/YER057c/UK114 family)